MRRLTLIQGGGDGAKEDNKRDGRKPDIGLAYSVEETADRRELSAKEEAFLNAFAAMAKKFNAGQRLEDSALQNNDVKILIDEIFSGMDLPKFDLYAMTHWDALKAMDDLIKKVGIEDLVMPSSTYGFKLTPLGVLLFKRLQAKEKIDNILG